MQIYTISNVWQIFIQKITLNFLKKYSEYKDIKGNNVQREIFLLKKLIAVNNIMY